MLETITIDFETKAIEARPTYPPKPVGVSIKLPHERTARYYAWGHPTGNNTTLTEAKRVLRAAWNDREYKKLFHNAKFDMDVAETHMGMRRLSWDEYHDTLFLLFLHTPHAESLSLKPSAERELGVKPTERDALRDWIIANVKCQPRKWGAYIADAPGGLVGRYSAKGDAMMTHNLFRKLYPLVHDAGMGAAYDRERRLMPILLDNERLGLRVDLKALERDVPVFEREGARVDAWVRKRLKAKDLNIDSNDDLATALLRARVAKENDFLRTPPSKTFPNGQLSVSKESLMGAISDKRLLQALGYRSRLGTVLTTFMKPWILIANENNGRIHTQWHQVRQGHGNDKDNSGARTGRIISSDPNLLNIAKTFEGRGDGYEHPRWMQELRPLPLVRLYVLPDEGELFLHRDYDQQELRILAHFEEGALQRQYQQNPHLDVHNFVRDEIKRVVGLYIKDRTRVKTINFGDIYGLGVPGLVRKLKCSVAEAKELKNAKRRAMPDVEELKRAIKETAQQGHPIKTWGGRLYYVEKPQIQDGEARTFEYKLLNYLIQGSAADMTKEAVIRYHAMPHREGRFLVTVYDEINGSAPKSAVAEELSRYRKAMESVEFDVPMLSTAKVGTSWGTLQNYGEHR